MSTKKLWGGRFEESAAAWIDQFGHRFRLIS